MQIERLGASAGGLEPLERFLASVPAASGLADLMVRHMDPTHKPLLAELLQRSTAMPVQEAADGTRIEPDTVHVIPPDAEMTVVEGTLHLAKPAEPRGQRLPIDVLSGMAMIVFRDVPADSGVTEELLRSREEIHARRQAMRASQEELQTIRCFSTTSSTCAATPRRSRA